MKHWRLAINRCVSYIKIWYNQCSGTGRCGRFGYANASERKYVVLNSHSCLNWKRRIATGSTMALIVRVNTLIKQAFKLTSIRWLVRIQNTKPWLIWARKDTHWVPSRTVIRCKTVILHCLLRNRVILKTLTKIGVFGGSWCLTAKLKTQRINRWKGWLTLTGYKLTKSLFQAQIKDKIRLKWS